MKEITYGMFHGGDPRDFSPDPESSNEEERARHKEDCAKWDRGEKTAVPVSGWVSDTVHVCRSAYGLGTYHFEMDDDDE